MYCLPTQVSVQMFLPKWVIRVRQIYEVVKLKNFSKADAIFVTLQITVPICWNVQAATVVFAVVC